MQRAAETDFDIPLGAAAARKAAQPAFVRLLAATVVLFLVGLGSQMSSIECLCGGGIKDGIVELGRSAGFRRRVTREARSTVSRNPGGSGTNQILMISR